MRLRAQPAWRAAAGDEEARAFLQARLATFARVTTITIGAVIAFFVLLYLFAPDIKPRLAKDIFAAWVFVLALFAVGSRALATSWSPSFRTLYTLDVASAVLVGVVMAAAVYFQPERRAAGYSSLIQTIFFLFARAFIVPSSGRRTAAVSAVAMAPLLAAAIGIVYVVDQDIPGPAYVTGAIVLCGGTVLLATVGSRIIYELRRQVSEITQLGQYTLEGKLGEGGMGTVHRGRHVLLRRPTAIKLIRPDRVGAAMLDRFELEVQHTSQLRHPNTVSVFDYGRTADGVFYYAMELLDGMNLEEVVKRYGPLPVRRTIDILVQVCGALHEAHERGIVHRDVKPANIILCEHGGVPDVAKVVDFGLVKEIAHDSHDSKESVVGTPAYMAPEMIAGTEGITPAADLYALGAVGYYLLTGRRVFEGSMMVAIVQHATAEAPRVSSSRLEVPPALDAVIARCLRKSPLERFASAAVLAGELRAIACDDWSEAAASAWWAERRSVYAPEITEAATQTVTIARRAP